MAVVTRERKRMKAIQKGPPAPGSHSLDLDIVKKNELYMLLSKYQDSPFRKHRKPFRVAALPDTAAAWFS